MPKTDSKTVQTTPDTNTQEDTMPKTTSKTSKPTAAATQAKPEAPAAAKPAAEAQAKPAVKPAGLLDPKQVALAAEQARRHAAEQYRDRLTAFLAEGKSVKQIAAEMGTSRVGVRKVMALLDLKPAGGSGGSGANAERDAKIAEMTAQGATPAQVAERFGLSVGRSRRIMQKHGYARQAGRTSAVRFESHEQAEVAVAAYQELAAYGGGSVKAAVRAVEAFLADEQGYQYATDSEGASEAESTVSESEAPESEAPDAAESENADAAPAE